MSEDLLKFVAFQSQVEPSFWQRLTEIKLEVDKLNENVHTVYGYYSHKKPEGQNHLLSVDASSFNELPEENRIFGIGRILNKNTIEKFKNETGVNLLKARGTEMMKIIKVDALEKPSLLARFFIFSYANLKNYYYYYWFIFPAPKFISSNCLDVPKNIKEILGPKQINTLCDSYSSTLDCHNRGFFFVKIDNDNLELFTIKDGLKRLNNENENWLLAFADTSDSKFPSWPLRNFIALVTYHCPDFVKQPLRIICLRQNFLGGRWIMDNSIVLKIQVNLMNDAWEEAELGENWVGLELNEKGKLGPRLAKLKLHMDPVCLAESSVDLNLKLMKWQILPQLNLNVIKDSKCLLIGAGTLGCGVARNLMSWGVRHITFIDYGTVSYSNPVRQCLYKFSDTGRPKAEAAAAALKEIFPGMVSTGLVFSIPMPGHPVGESLLEETKKSVKHLEELIDSHDVTFLLMDSRESRWLPTLIAAAKEKLVINAALGFESYLVMRHGIKRPLSENEDDSGGTNYKLLDGEKLGCYFCHDVTAPGNSFTGRTLDQQCTVTRPGVSNMAAGLAVELFASILQHPLGGLAPAETDTESEGGSLLGIVPHSVRGYLSHYEIVIPAVEAFSSCVACSRKVINKYQQEGLDFVLKSLESKEYLEDLCGLNELQNEVVLTEVMEFTSSESDEEVSS